MLYPDRRVFRLLLLLLDLCALIGAFHLAVETRIALNSFYKYQMTAQAAAALTPPLGLILLLWIPMSLRLRLYRPRRGVLAGAVRQVVESVVALAVLTIVVTFFIRNFGEGFSRTFVLFFAADALGTLMLARLAMWVALAVCHRRGYAREHVALAGSGEEAKRLAARIEAARRAGVDLRGVIATAPVTEISFGNPVPVIGTLDQAGALINLHKLDRIIAVDSEIDRMGLQTLAATCARMGVALHRIPANVELEAARLHLHELGDVQLLEVRGIGFTPAQAFIKRVFDVCVGSLLLVAAAPLMLSLAALIKLTSPGPVLYVAPRVGKGGRHFPFYKFRSMVADAERRRADLATRNEKGGHLFKIKDDPRLTAIGRFMRRFSLDELPQLVNVLKGDMSLVGPRPLPAGDLDLDGLSREHAFWARERTRVLPGITGLWQVRGRSATAFDDMIRHDVAYARTWSVWQDLWILAATLPAVLRGRGAC